VYEGSDGAATVALYTRLHGLGPAGDVAVELLRAQKSSARAKVYRGGVRGRGSFRGMAYDRKQWALGNLATALARHAAALSLVWGWGDDRGQKLNPWVLYVELPTGQVSFHSPSKGAGPMFPGRWDAMPGASEGRVVQWVASLLSAADDEVRR
jgi:hypothetical protein